MYDFMYAVSSVGYTIDVNDSFLLPSKYRRTSLYKSYHRVFDFSNQKARVRAITSRRMRYVQTHAYERFRKYNSMHAAKRENCLKKVFVSIFSLHTVVVLFLQKNRHIWRQFTRCPPLQLRLQYHRIHKQKNRRYRFFHIKRNLRGYFDEKRLD